MAQSNAEKSRLCQDTPRESPSPKHLLRRCSFNNRHDYVVVCKDEHDGRWLCDPFLYYTMGSVNARYIDLNYALINCPTITHVSACLLIYSSVIGHSFEEVPGQWPPQEWQWPAVTFDEARAFVALGLALNDLSWRERDAILLKFLQGLVPSLRPL